AAIRKVPTAEASARHYRAERPTAGAHPDRARNADEPRLSALTAGVRIMNAYVIVTSPAFAERAALQAFLDTVPEVRFWYACLPQCVFCTSALSARELTTKLRAQFGDGLFLVLTVSGPMDGILPRQAWQLLN